MSEAHVVVCADREDIASRALDLVAAALGSAIEARGMAHLALTGGSSASALFTLLRSEVGAHALDWSRVHVWQGDERFVSLDHPDRNWADALREWLETPAAADIPREQLHPVPCDVALATGHDASWAAQRYAQELVQTLPDRDGIPAFDLVLLGMGGDGHILSTFPGTAPIGETSMPVLAVAAPTHIEPHLPRVTLSPYLLGAAGSVVVMVPGASKAQTVADVLRGPADAQRLPAQLAILPATTWLLEPGSASSL